MPVQGAVRHSGAVQKLWCKRAVCRGCQITRDAGTNGPKQRFEFRWLRKETGGWCGSSGADAVQMQTVGFLQGFKWLLCKSKTNSI
ncbi:unnamed protein product [Malus baccata var. baccata]